VRILFWFLLLAAAAVAVALALTSRLSTGYALFVAPPWRIELSLNFLIVLVVLLSVGGYALVRLGHRVMRLPKEVAAYRRRQAQERARANQDAATIALLEGRFGKARQAAEEALAIPGTPGLSALIAARAALEIRDFAEVARLLAMPSAQTTSLAVPRLMLDAEAKLEQGRPTEALTTLAALRKEAGAHTAALRLALRAMQRAGRYAEIPPLVDQLVKRKVYGASEGEHLRAAAHAEELAALANSTTGLRAYWNGLSEAEKRMPKVAAAAAKSFIALGGDREAAEIIAKSLERDWNSDLVVLYARCRTADPTRQLGEAERWLTHHNQDPALLYALGLLCQREQLWGKAQTYLEASLALADDYRTHVALGELFARLGRNDDANAHLAAALKLALAELGGS
jgi:HemY protein